MGAVEDIFSKPPDKVEVSDLQKLIDEKREETRNLEYKSPDILSKPVDLSEWVSAFLNADGGLIIIGLCESDKNKKNNINTKIFPVKLEFVGSSYTKERVEQLVINNIGCSSRPEIRIYPIRNPNDYSQAIYLIEVPQGDNPPYQAQNKKYYRRLNATKYEMPHTEIADFFGRRRKPKLVLRCLVINPEEFEMTELKKAQDSGAAGVLKLRQSYSLRLIVYNLGLAAAKYVRIAVSFENIDIERVISGPNHRIDELREDIPTLQWDETKGIIYAGKGADVVWELQVKLKKKRWGKISWQAFAEDMDYQEGTYVLLGVETKKLGEKEGSYWLPKYEDVFRDNSKEQKLED
ncbi:MAG: ATP-binding protein [Dehalococcoidales bacterium]